MNNGKEKKRKGTLFKCQVYLAFRHINWGHCKLKLIQIKFNQMQVFEERGKPEYPGKNLSEQRREENQQTQPTYDSESGNRTRTTLMGGESSHHYATTARGRTQFD